MGNLRHAPLQPQRNRGRDKGAQHEPDPALLGQQSRAGQTPAWRYKDPIGPFNFLLSISSHKWHNAFSQILYLMLLISSGRLEGKLKVIPSTI